MQIVSNIEKGNCALGNGTHTAEQMVFVFIACNYQVGLATTKWLFSGHMCNIPAVLPAISSWRGVCSLWLPWNVKDHLFVRVRQLRHLWSSWFLYTARSSVWQNGIKNLRRRKKRRLLSCCCCYLPQTIISIHKRDRVPSSVVVTCIARTHIHSPIPHVSLFFFSLLPPPPSPLRDNTH